MFSGNHKWNHLGSGVSSAGRVLISVPISLPGVIQIVLVLLRSVSLNHGFWRIPLFSDVIKFIAIKFFRESPYYFVFWFCRDYNAVPCFSSIISSFLPFSFLSSLLVFLFKESNFWLPDLFYCVFIFFIIHFFIHSFILIIIFLLLWGSI